MDFILTAMAKLQEVSCVRFVPYDSDKHKDYIKVEGERKGCFSNLGRQGDYFSKLDKFKKYQSIQVERKSSTYGQTLSEKDASSFTQLFMSLCTLWAFSTCRFDKKIFSGTFRTFKFLFLQERVGQRRLHHSKFRQHSKRCAAQLQKARC